MVLLRKRKGIITHVIRRPEPLRRFTGIMAVWYWDCLEEKKRREGREAKKRCMSETMTDYNK